MSFKKSVLSIIASTGILSSTTVVAEEVRPLQELLSERSCNPGPVDGLWGRKTANALVEITAGSDIAINRPITLDDISLLQGSALACDAERMPSVNLQLELPVTVDTHGFFATRNLGCSSCVPIQRILATPDLDADGVPEIVIGFEAFDSEIRPTENEIEIQILRRDGEPYEGFSGSLMRTHPREGIVADFNGDGIDDLFIAAHGKDGQPFPGEQNVLVVSAENGTHVDKSFDNLPDLQAMTHGASAGDIDGDGDLDIAAVVNANGGVSGVRNYFLLNDGSGNFSLSNGSNHLPSGAARNSREFLTTRLIDVDQDGNVDLFYVSSIRRQPSLLMYGEGNGRFGAAITLPDPDWEYAAFNMDIDALDLDGDGDLDLASLHTGEINGGLFRGMYVQLLLNNGDEFLDATEYLYGPQDRSGADDFYISHNLNVVDLDADGDLDFVVQSLAELRPESARRYPAHIILNRGNGVFDAAYFDDADLNFKNVHQATPIQVQGQISIYGLSHSRNRNVMPLELLLDSR